MRHEIDTLDTIFNFPKSTEEFNTQLVAYLNTLSIDSIKKIRQSVLNYCSLKGFKLSNKNKFIFREGKKPTMNNESISVEEFLDMTTKLDRNNDAHVHADLMALYAIDAKTTSEPWKLWELRPVGYLKWKECNRNPTWCRNMEYRQKPKTHIVNGVEIPELRVNVLNENEKFYLVNIVSEKYYGVVKYLKSNKNLFDLWIERGLVYENSEEGKNACIMHSKALIKNGLCF